MAVSVERFHLDPDGNDRYVGNLTVLPGKLEALNDFLPTDVGLMCDPHDNFGQVAIIKSQRSKVYATLIDDQGDIELTRRALKRPINFAGATKVIIFQESPDGNKVGVELRHVSSSQQESPA